MLKSGLQALDSFWISVGFTYFCSLYLGIMTTKLIIN